MHTTGGLRMSMYTGFNVDDNRYFYTNGAGLSTVSKTLPCGIYKVFYGDYTTDLIPVVPDTDNLLILPDSLSKQVIEDVQNFNNPLTQSKFEEFGFSYKRGILMHGIPGTGKTATINLVAKMFVKQGGIVLLNPPPFTVNDIVSNTRQLQPEQKFLVVWEDFEGIANRDRGLLSLLDGQDQVHGIVYLATTNYINLIPDNIQKRPSRFAKIIEVLPPSADMRRVFFEQKIPVGYKTDGIIDMLVEKTDGLVLDHLKDVIVAHFCLNMKLDLAIDTARDLAGINKKDENDEDEDDDEDGIKEVVKAVEVSPIEKALSNHLDTIEQATMQVEATES